MVALRKIAASQHLGENDHMLKAAHSHSDHLEAVDCKNPQQVAVEKALDGQQGDEGCGFRTSLM